MADVVFILGAGCSVHAGAPVMNDFLDRARELYSANEVADKAQEFERAFSVVSDLQRVHSKAKLDHNNIESVFSAVDLARTIRKLPGTEPDQIDVALKSLIWLIVRTLERSIKFPLQGGFMRGPAEYTMLAQLIGELSGRTPRLSSAVLTFNYDICAEMAFVAEHVPFTYALAESSQGVPLLKLHGSLNWGRTRGESPQIVPYEIRQYVADHRYHYFPGDSEGSVPTDVSANMATHLVAHNIEPEPLIVPPTWSKGEHHRGISKVWARAAKELESARYIYVLGYSLPETDQFFRLLFALGTEGRSVLSRMTVFDPHPGPVGDRFRDMLGNAALDRFKVQGVRFGQGLNLIEQELFATGQRRPR